MRKIFKVAHSWLAAPVGIILVITCLTGAILVFKDEILEISNPTHYYVDEVKDEPIALEKLIPLVNNQLTDNTVVDVKITSDPERTYTMTLAEGFRISVFVDPYTGLIVGTYDTKEHIFWDVMTLHRWLMDGSRTWGKYIVGISTLVMVFILITGLVLWKPKRKKHLKQNLTIKRKSGKKRLMYDLHNVLGAYACLILLACCLTGMMWSFDWYREGVFKIFGAEEQETGEKRSHGKKKQKEAPIAIDASQWQSVFAKVAEANPSYEYIRISDGAAMIHDQKAIRSRDTDRYNFEKETGEIEKVTKYSDQPKTSQIWGWVYSIHVGDYFGIWSKIFTCLASLVGASLPITGYYLYFTKRKRKMKKRKKEINSVSLPM